MAIRDVAPRRGTIHLFKVGGDGKPVRIRRGPATVIGDAGRITSHWRRRVAGKARLVGPSARRPAPDRQADMPSWKGVALMHRKTLVALLGAIVMAVAASGVALAAGSGPAVTVQIKSLNKTLLKPTTEHGQTGWITKGGTPKGKCSGNSAAGALNAATHGKWAGQVLLERGQHLRHVDPRGEAERLGLLGAVRQRQACEHRRMRNQAEVGREVAVQDHQGVRPAGWS